MKDFFDVDCTNQRWSPRRHIIKSLTLASKPSSSRKCPVLGRGKYYFLIGKNGQRSTRFFFFVLGNAKTSRKIYNIILCEDLFFFGEHVRGVFLVFGLGLEHSCPWPLEGLSLEFQKVSSWPWPWILFVSLALASSFVSSTPSLVQML